MNEVHIDRAALLRAVQDPTTRLLLRVGNQVRTQAALNCPVDFGRLRSSIQMALRGDSTVRVGSDVEYALYVHEGTKPHVIRPVNKKALHWVGPDGDVFAMKVNHPGTRAQPFLRDAMETVINSL